MGASWGVLGTPRRRLGGVLGGVGRVLEGLEDVKQPQTKNGPRNTPQNLVKKSFVKKSRRSSLIS